MRWAWRRCPTSGASAYGEVVWSWRPKALASSWRRCLKHRGRRRWQTGWFTGESTYKPSNHCAGKAGVITVCTCGLALAQFFLREGPGCSGHPVFPAPSTSGEGHVDAELGREAPRDRSRMQSGERQPGKFPVSASQHGLCFHLATFCRLMATAQDHRCKVIGALHPEQGTPTCGRLPGAISNTA